MDESIDFKRGLGSKKALNVGHLAHIRSQVQELIRRGYTFRVYGYYDNWSKDSYFFIDDARFKDDYVIFAASFEDEDGDLVTTRGDFKIDNIAEIYIDEEDDEASFIDLKKPEAAALSKLSESLDFKRGQGSKKSLNVGIWKDAPHLAEFIQRIEGLGYQAVPGDYPTEWDGVDGRTVATFRRGDKYLKIREYKDPWTGDLMGLEGFDDYEIEIGDDHDPIGDYLNSWHEMLHKL
jgi:hypothetical protein